MVGLSGGSARSEAFRGQGTGTMWMNRVECSGSETEIQACSFSGWGNHNCVHLEDASVCCDWGDVCQENAKLTLLSWSGGQEATSENCICSNEFFGSVSRGEVCRACPSGSRTSDDAHNTLADCSFENNLRLSNLDSTGCWRIQIRHDGSFWRGLRRWLGHCGCSGCLPGAWSAGREWQGVCV